MTRSVQLGEVVTLRKGKKAAQVYDARVNGALPYIQIDEVRGSAPKQFACDPRGVEVEPSDLCIVWDGANAGTVGYGIRGLIGSTVSRLRLVDRNRWDTRFIGRLLQSKFVELNGDAQGRGATIPHVDKSRLEAIELPAIDKHEQERIAAILDKADGIRRKREQAHAMSEELLKSTFLEMFGWPNHPNPALKVVPLGEVCDLFAGNSLPPGEAYDGQGDGLLLLKVADLNLPGNDQIVTTAREWVSERGGTRAAIVAPKNAIVFPKRGGAIATNKKRVLGRPSVLDPNLMAVAPQNGAPITYPYLRMWFELLDLTSISNGSTVPQLNKGDLHPLKMAIPERGTLAAFERVFQAVSHVRHKHAADTVCSEALFSTLSQRAFRGEL
jgi:type I restriction enzyme S subunit